jgi:hypothetical protein
VRRTRVRCDRAGFAAARDQLLLAPCDLSGEEFFFVTDEPGHRPRFFAGTPARRNGGLIRESVAVARGRAAEFTYADDLSSAEVTPPPPFRGSATFAAAGRTGELTGDLRAQWPGIKRLTLTPREGFLGHGNLVDCGRPNRANRLAPDRLAALTIGAGSR